MDKKLKLALYWASSCGGCDIATLAIGDKILELAKVADILLWPIAMDFKYSDVDKLAPFVLRKTSIWLKCYGLNPKY